MRFTDLTYEEVRDRARRGACVFVPLGCTEQQGPHLPVGFDTMMISAMTEAIAERIESQHGRDVLVLPALPYGPAPEHTGFGAGYVNLRQSTHEAVVLDVVESMAAQGFRTILVWRGCGQHDLAAVIQRFNVEHTSARAWQPVVDYPATADRVFGRPVPGGHADSFATSICLLLRPEAVRRDLIARPVNKAFEWGSAMDFSAISDTGVIGDPTAASEDAGAALWDAIIAEGTAITLAILDGRGESVRTRWHLGPEDT